MAATFAARRDYYALRKQRPAVCRVLGCCMKACGRFSSHAVCRAAPSDVLVLDMDGVLVDSEPEVSRAGIHAAAKLWPDVFPADVEAVTAKLQPAMRTLRPALVHGRETMIMARLLQEGMQADDILTQYEAIQSACCERWNVTLDDLETYLEDFRRTWMQEQPEEYLAANQVYSGVDTSLLFCEYPFYIASSKKANRVSALATNLLKLKGFDEDSPRLFAALLPPNEAKADALRTVMSRPLCSEESTKLHFVDDRAETLHHIAQQADLSRWQLYFADWGYCTDDDKASMAAEERVQSIDLKQFHELLKWGVVMGVDDGCEPEPHEVQQMIADGNRRP